MANIIKIKKGLDIPLGGAASEKNTADTSTDSFGIVPDDFPGHKWKCTVKPGDCVLAGTELLHSKEHEHLKLVSPVAGTVSEVRRGERRKIEAVVINTDQSVKESDNDCFYKFDIPSLDSGREAILSLLCEAGIFALIRQRPYDIVPDPSIVPRDIFITAFDTAPLASKLISFDMKEMHEKGLEVLSKLTDGNVYLSVRYDSEIGSSHAKVYEFAGPHPAGNVGVQIANIRPVNRGDVVWTLDSRTVVRIGRLFHTGKTDNTAEVTVCGDMASDPHIINTKLGASLKTLLKGQIKNCENAVRVINGNVLTGIKSDPERDFLRYPYRQITLIAEGNTADEFMGWASLSTKKFSVKRSFPSFFLGKRGNYKFDARLRGGRRAMILSGEFDKVFPMDIYPEFLLKAIIAGDIEKMEQLGIYEVAPEDFALPEFVDTSKEPLQRIVREGLDRLRAELS